MKFAHSFTEEIQSSKYPAEWRDAAIHYRQLKKCIKKVEKELVELGLSADMLKSLAEQKDAFCAVQTPRLSCSSSASPASCVTTDSPLLHSSVSLLQQSNGSGSIASLDGDTGDFDKQGLQDRNLRCPSKDMADWGEEACGKFVTVSYCFDGL